MVQDTGAAPSAGAIKPLDAPVRLEMEVNEEGAPSKIRLGRWVEVAGVQDCWRIDDEWWRARPVTRTYYRVVLQNGLALTIYLDQETGTWYQQSYA